MTYVLVEWEHEEDDEPYQIYSELDSCRLETRKVEFYKNGLVFSYGGERGNADVLSKIPFPEDLQSLTLENKGMTARTISPSHFFEIWNQAQERPDGFMGMFF